MSLLSLFVFFGGSNVAAAATSGSGFANVEHASSTESGQSSGGPTNGGITSSAAALTLQPSDEVVAGKPLIVAAENIFTETGRSCASLTIGGSTTAATGETGTSKPDASANPTLPASGIKHVSDPFKLSSTTRSGDVYDPIEKSDGGVIEIGGATLQVRPLRNAATNTTDRNAATISPSAVIASSVFCNLVSGSDFNDNGYARGVRYSAFQVHFTVKTVFESTCFAMILAGTLAAFLKRERRPAFR